MNNFWDLEIKNIIKTTQSQKIRFNLKNLLISILKIIRNQEQVQQHIVHLDQRVFTLLIIDIRYFFTLLFLRYHTNLQSNKLELNEKVMIPCIYYNNTMFRLF